MSFRSGGGWSGDDGQAPETARVDDDRRYTENGVLGVGGMGEVVAVEDARLQREVALKRVPLGPFSDRKAARLAREALITAGLEHPNIVPVYDAGEGPDGRMFYTMRLVRGRSLAEAIPSEPNPLRLIQHFQDVCNAVAYAHDRGIVHRDLKPANIMVGRFGETQVMDWGLAAPTGEEAGVVGTPEYMSPQQSQGLAADPKDDVYSLGVVLGHLASTPELVAVAERARAERPAERYTAAELAQEIAAWQAGERVRAYDYTPWELLVRFAQAWRTPLVVTAAAALILAVGVGSAWRETDEKLVWALESQARTALADGSLAEAQVLAAHALAHRESVVARGVLALRTPRPDVDVHAVEDCAWGARDGDDIVCAGASVRLYRNEELVWTSPHLTRTVRIEGDRVLFSTDEAALMLERDTGRVLEERHQFSRLGAFLYDGELMLSNGIYLIFPEHEVAVPCTFRTPALALRLSERGIHLACTDGCDPEHRVHAARRC